MRVLLLSILCVAIVQSQKFEHTLTKEECRDAGFVPESLKCSTCENLGNFDLETLMSDCQACCIKEKELVHAKYPLANVEVCECNLARFPQVQAFVHKNMASQFGGRVKIRHVRGVRPQIVLKNHAGQSVDTLNIEKWDTDTIIDYLNQWIE